MAPWISRRVQQLLFVLLLRQKIHGSKSESIERAYNFEIVIRNILHVNILTDKLNISIGN